MTQFDETERNGLAKVANTSLICKISVKLIYGNSSDILTYPTTPAALQPL